MVILILFRNGVGTVYMAGVGDENVFFYDRGWIRWILVLCGGGDQKRYWFNLENKEEDQLHANE